MVGCVPAQLLVRPHRPNAVGTDRLGVRCELGGVSNDVAAALDDGEEADSLAGRHPGRGNKLALGNRHRVKLPAHACRRELGVTWDRKHQPASDKHEGTKWSSNKHQGDFERGSA